ncbi:MAG: flagellar hook-length control protein FliK [Oscillospiraceae bacterium]|nr:flagellar hook-length control protein FliK [Oscillospiraceae bacterium]
MAVSMNAGFMRSDYMISDAALPMRMEELEQLEQTAEFAEILGGFGDVPADDMAQMPTEQPAETVEAVVDVPDHENEFNGMELTKPVLSKSELKALARAVASGEMKLSEIPQELVTDQLLTVIAMMMLGIPEDEIPALSEVSEVVQENVVAAVATPDTDSLNTVTSKVVQEILPELKAADKSDELYQLIAKLAETASDENADENADETVVQTIESMVARMVRTEDAGADTNVEATLEVKQTVDEVIGFAEQTAQPVTENAAPVVADAEKTTADAIVTDHVAANVQAEIGTQAVRATDAPAQHEQRNMSAESGTNASQNMYAAEKTAVSDEFEQIRSIISEVRVTRNEQSAEHKVPEQAFVSQEVVTGENAKSRVVVKSDELMMLKNAAKPAAEIRMDAPTADTDSAQVMRDAAVTLQPMGEQLPVVFTRTDGTEVLVQPEEVLKQVTESIVQQSTTAEGDTEYSITLTPEDLGSITVKLTKAVDGSLSVSIMADNAKTQRIIEENGYAIQNSLKQNGIELESWQTVNESNHEARAEDYSNSSRNPYYHAEENTDSEDEEDTSFAELISAM